ncbi:MAG: arsenosugar biosynthesis radical SAM protein ArsS [Acidobacteria bacterium]|nr:arsenosugar biosynthesis radical SAM protein ArsS [Acidobacteriota bacterium]
MSVPALKLSEVPAARYNFARILRERNISLPPTSVETLQVNITKLCNQACRHCHVDASPARTEKLSRAGVEKLVEILARHPQIKNLDLTGGAPELHPDFDWLVTEAVKLGHHVMVRHNLTVIFDGNPQTKESKDYLPEFFAKNRCEVISSLPCYQEHFTDAQRGSGVFKKSIEGIRRLNALGYGVKGSGLVLNLVYNPVGPYLPPPQASLEAEYKKELKEKFGLVFNSLFTITNMPINRFMLHLEKSGQYEEYMEKLLNAFNPAAAEGVMCRSLISVDHEGVIYDCDFNQMLDMKVGNGKGPATIFDFDFDALMQRRIRFDTHCFGCTAGAGSSCGGATA